MVRVQHQVPRKRRKKNTTTEFPILEAFGTEPRLAPQMMVPVADHPSFLFLPVLPPPRLLVGAVPLPDVGYWFRPVVDDAKARSDRLMASGKKGVKLYGEIKLGVFARMVAKIAHAYAVARLGLNGFRPLLVDEILVGKEPANLIGGPPNPVREARADSHLVEIEFVTFAAKEYVVVWIWLFAYLGTPIYGAVAGEALPHTDRTVR